eukprot:g2237.t1
MLGTEGKVVYNDLLLHKYATQHATEHAGKVWPIDFHLPGVGLGFPLFSHYHHLPHAAIAAFRNAALWIGAEEGAMSCELVALLALSLMPWSIYKGLRWMGIDRLSSSFACTLYPLLSDKAPSMNWRQGRFFSYGFGWNSYTHSGHGLWSQLIASLFLLPAIGASYRAITTHSSRKENRARTVLLLRAATLGSVCVLSHMFCGYIVFASAGLLCIIPLLRFDFNEVRLRLLRYSFMLLVAALQTAYFVVPFIVNREHACDVEYRQWKFDSVGFEWLLEQLPLGTIFDVNPPVAVVTACIFCGSASGIVLWIVQWCTRKSHVRQARPVKDSAAYTLIGLAFWLAMFAGPAGFGKEIAQFVPFGHSLHFHRFILAVHIFALPTASLSVELLQRLCPRRLRRMAAALVALATIAAALSKFKARRHDVADAMESIAMRKRAMSEQHSAEYSAMLSAIEMHMSGSPFRGRAFAGMPGYRWLVFAHPKLLMDGIDVLGPTLHTMSHASHYSEWFDHMNEDHYNLFNVRYLVQPAMSRTPPFGNIIFQNDIAQVTFVNASSGYFDVRYDCASQKISARARSCMHPLLHDAQFGRGHGRVSGVAVDSQSSYLAREISFRLSDLDANVDDGTLFHGTLAKWSAPKQEKLSHDLEKKSVTVIRADPFDGCSVSDQGMDGAFFLFVNASSCSLSQKLRNALNVGARGVLVGTDDEAGGAIDDWGEGQLESEYIVFAPSKVLLTQWENGTAAAKLMRLHQPVLKESEPVVLTLQEMESPHRKLPLPRTKLTRGGQVLKEAVDSSLSTYRAKVSLDGSAQVVLKVNYHPFFKCTIDGMPAKSHRIIPGFLAVNTSGFKGEHEVVCAYEPPLYKKVLAGISIIFTLTLGGLQLF